VARRLTYFILAGLVLGIVVGWALNAGLHGGTPAGDAQLKTVAGYF
jgi:hypothetical protein